MPKISTSSRRIFAMIGALVAFLAPESPHGQVNVTTWHNDNGRTGQNTSEVHLTTAINKNNFGRLCKISLPRARHRSRCTLNPW